MSVLILFVLLILGSVGFLVLGNDRDVFESLYVTVLILTTVGMKESSLQLNTSEQYWAVFLMLTGISTALYAAGNLVALIIEGDVRRLLGRRQLQSRIDQLHDHFIVCGFGRMGQALCETLASRNQPFVLIDCDSERTTVADSMGYLYILGDATSEDVLRSARIDIARGLATCLHRDPDNVFVTISARGLNDTLSIIARSEQQNTENTLKRAGADRVICLPLLGAGKVTQMLLQPAIEELIEMTVKGPDIEVSKVPMSELPQATGQTLRELEMREKTGVMVVAVIHDDGHREFGPRPDAILKETDELIIIGPNGSVDMIVEQFGATETA